LLVETFLLFVPELIVIEDLPLLVPFSNGQSCPQVGQVFLTLAPHPPQKEAD
jgi:hypothetical protein